ncbi:MAG TPA: AbrB/MazE/SpoVT family DNA-binding domain-containing protein [Chloroflexota bacterium]|nr:AbrB/MazE/SpoVT family DNA-binding domain-containing protein [Chloroflexota bacterium]
MSETTGPTRIVKSLRGGQVTIPADFRRELGIDAETLLQVTLERGQLRITPVRTSARGTRSAWLQKLYEQVAPVRASSRTLSEAEVNDAIDAAVKAVRSKHA